MSAHLDLVFPRPRTTPPAPKTVCVRLWDFGNRKGRCLGTIFGKTPNLNGTIWRGFAGVLPMASPSSMKSGWAACGSRAAARRFKSHLEGMLKAEDFATCGYGDHDGVRTETQVGFLGGGAVFVLSIFLCPSGGRTQNHKMPTSVSVFIISRAAEKHKTHEGLALVRLQF